MCVTNAQAGNIGAFERIPGAQANPQTREKRLVQHIRGESSAELSHIRE